MSDSIKWSKVIDNLTDGIVAEIGRQFAVKDKEIERLEKLLAECCRKLECIQHIKHTSPELRDWYGKYRNREKS